LSEVLEKIEKLGDCILRGNLLFDASSLIYALKMKYVDIFYKNYIQSLTIYEVLNAIWKEVYLIKSITHEEAEKLVSVIVEVISYLNILSIHPYEMEVLKEALNLGLTIYDASYVVLAEKNDLVLVTEDKRLIEKASKKIRVISLNDLIVLSNANYTYKKVSK